MRKLQKKKKNDLKSWLREGKTNRGTSQTGLENSGRKQMVKGISLLPSNKPFVYLFRDIYGSRRFNTTFSLSFRSFCLRDVSGVFSLSLSLYLYELAFSGFTVTQSGCGLD